MAKKKVDPEIPEPAKVKKAVTKKAAPVVNAETKPAKPAKKSSPAKAVTAPTSDETVLKSVEPYSRFTDFDIGLFKSGKHYKLYEKFGSGISGSTFFLAIFLSFRQPQY